MNGSFGILLADDDEILGMLIERAIESAPDLAGCTLARVDDGTQAVAYLRGDPPFDDRSKHPMPDLLLLDQRMKRMDGSEALAEIKSDPELAGLPVCILSTSDEERLRALCYSRGATFFIRKALDYEQLRRKLGVLVRFFRDVLEVN